MRMEQALWGPTTRHIWRSRLPCERLPFQRAQVPPADFGETHEGWVFTAPCARCTHLPIQPMPTRVHHVVAANEQRVHRPNRDCQHPRAWHLGHQQPAGLSHMLAAPMTKLPESAITCPQHPPVSRRNPRYREVYAVRRWDRTPRETIACAEHSHHVFVARCKQVNPSAHAEHRGHTEAHADCADCTDCRTEAHADCTAPRGQFRLVGGSA
jgi:hypothetical protein